MSNNLSRPNIQPQNKTLHSFDHVHIIFDSIVKVILWNALDREIYTWGYAVMTLQNCPPKILQILNGQIKTKSTYIYLLKKCSPGIKRPTKLQNQNMNEKYNRFYQNPDNQDKINEETKKIVQIIKDNFPIIIPTAQICFFGDHPIQDQILVDYLNDLFSNFEGGQKFCKKLPKNQKYQIGKMMKPYEEKIKQRQYDLINSQMRKTWLEQNKVYQQMMFKPGGYKKGKFQMTKSQHNKTEAQKTNGIELLMNLVEQYVDQFSWLENGRKCQNNGRYIPKNITTEVLIRKNAEHKSSEQQMSTGPMSVQNIQPTITIPSISQMVHEIVPQISGSDKEDGELDSNKKSNKTKKIQKKMIEERKKQNLKCQQYIKSLIEQGISLDISQPFFKNRYSYFNYNTSIRWNVMNEQKRNKRVHRNNQFSRMQNKKEDKIIHRGGLNPGYTTFGSINYKAFTI